jgi:hypothetical protein
MPIFFLLRYGFFKILPFYAYTTNIGDNKKVYTGGTGSVIQGRIWDVVVNFPQPAVIENQNSFSPVPYLNLPKQYSPTAFMTAVLG